MSPLSARFVTTQCLLVRTPITACSRNASLVPIARVQLCGPELRLKVPTSPTACQGWRLLSTARPRKPANSASSPASPSTPRAATLSATPSNSSTGNSANGKYEYPERLVIYHAGTGRTVFLGWLKIATIFTFVFFGLLVSPRYLAADEPMWAAAYFVGGLVPFIFVAYTTSPFVTFINVYLPPFARTSKEMLQRFAKAPPPSTRLDISTLSLIGKPRVSGTTVGALQATRQRFGIVNYGRDTTEEEARRQWWRFRAVRGFNIQPGMEGRLKTGWVWKDIAEGIGRRNRM